MEALFDIFDCSWKYGEKRVDQELSQRVKDSFLSYCDESSIKFYLLNVEEVEVKKQENFDVILNVVFRQDVDINDVYEFITLTSELLRICFNKKVRYFYFERPRDRKHKERLAKIRIKHKEKLEVSY